MATTLTDQAATIVSLASTANWVQVILPSNCRYLWIRATTANVFFSYVGSDGGAVGTSYLTLSTGTTYNFKTNGWTSVYVASTAAAHFVAYSCEVT